MKQSRRQMLRLTGQAVAAAALAPSFCIGAQRKTAEESVGAIVGEKVGAEAGLRILAEGGNAIDAIVAGALVSCVAAPARCGVGGYGGHLTIALAGGTKVTSIDFNSTAPRAARPDMYPLDDAGKVKGDINFHGWLAVGVPGTLAGIQMALDRYGTRSFRELAQPAIQLAKKGLVMPGNLATTLRSAAPRLRKDPGSAKIYFKEGEPLKADEILHNPELAELLSTLAERNSVESFYRGDIAQRLADEFKKKGGLVTAADLAAYQACEVQPLKMDWKEFSIHTAPLTAGGLTVLEALTISKTLDTNPRSNSGKSVHARLEALRLAWKDRLELLGDPEKVRVPVEKLLSRDYARDLAKKIGFALKQQRPVPIEIQKNLQDGTVNLSCVDRHGNMMAMTLTHGGGFGAQVTAEGLGVMLGHGMSRFNPRPDHPNCPAPGKRPLHNMCPLVVLRRGKPVVAVGAAGGVKIPNALYEVLTQFVARGETLESAVSAPRIHCTGTTEVSVERMYPKESTDYLKQVGFDVSTGPHATVRRLLRFQEWRVPIRHAMKGNHPIR